jgi:hypothetical protein
MSIRPNLLARDVDVHGLDLPAVLAHLLDRLRRVGDIGNHDARALARQPLAERLPISHRRARDDGNPIFESSHFS